MPFTEIELDYLASQPLGRLATAHPTGSLQVKPVVYRYNTRTGTIDIGGRRMAASQKFRNVTANGRVGFVVDDVVSPETWQVRCVEIRGHAEAITEPVDSAWEGADVGYDGAIIRVHPRRVISFGIENVNPAAAGKR
ncbi:pyridoxamine 5'-phosphate oxidase [Actinosynnema sp. ALI-1.44]|uniref:PPOX class F420-dependent oxidoreductase n=1 Tax=Actinosynnema sp. ALI-1.44 TaxID=1933779 RepID=UPI00097C1DA7|nr:PPOX class F420-dependent oxidoreductase [Actinosynnema sp. ALI-1.44]ONI81602.1 pyridoxamine 5'-phosphate oxidase [Actinosynnema sp. ALI-1.44]